MRDSRILGTIFASFFGLGIEAHAFDAEPETGFPVWLVRHKLNRLGFHDIYRVSPVDGGFAVLAHDQWGRNVKLFVDARTGEVVPRSGYGLRHLRRGELARHLATLGYASPRAFADRDGRYRVRVAVADGTTRVLNVDPLSGAVWFEGT